MARKKRKRKPRIKGGTFIGKDFITLRCSACGKEAQIERTGDNIDEILDVRTKGWYTVGASAATCPRCTLIAGNSDHPALLNSRVHGRAENAEDIRKIMERAKGNGNSRHSSPVQDTGSSRSTVSQETRLDLPSADA